MLFSRGFAPDMAQLSDLKLKYRLLIQGYPFRRVDWRPGTRLEKPLKEARIALITTAGFYLPGQKAFDHSFRHDDCSFPEIPWGTPPPETLKIGQSSDAFDHSGIEADRNLALPLDRLRGLVEAGVVGEVAPRQFSTMGSLIAPARLISESGPEIARKLKEDAVDAVLLAPVCPFCHQAAGLLQSIIEKTGIAIDIAAIGNNQTRRAASCPGCGQVAWIPLGRAPEKSLVGHSTCCRARWLNP
jgi:D-proline reductase (dithiol) PrdB